jgi:glycosyltransferase involved in cell wall biosynthesis
MREREHVRIARIIARLNVGGPARHTVWLTEALNDGDFESVLIAGTVPSGEQDMSDFAAAHGVRPIVFKEMSREVSPRDVITIWKLFRFFARYRPHIVHTHTAKAGTVGRIAGLIYRLFTIGAPKCRFVHTYHGHVFHSYYGAIRTRLFLAIEKVLARLNTDAIVVLSNQQRDEIHRRFRVGRESQFHVIPLGLDLGEITNSTEGRSALRQKLKLRDGVTAVGIVGRLAPIKNHDLFLRVAARMPRAGVAYVVYGDGSERTTLEERAASLGVRELVTFAGTWAAADIYRSVDIVALTSRNEGTPLTLIEAMANGLPVISTAVGGVVDLLGAVEDSIDGYEVRERGITAPSDDERAFAAGLQRLINDDALRQRIAVRGANFARVTYSKGRLIVDIIRLYRELLGTTWQSTSRSQRTVSEELM